MNIGFSTGSLALGDFYRAIEMLEDKHVNSIEISSLRENELQFLVKEIDNIDLSKYKHISIHAPSKIINYSETEIISLLSNFFDKGWLVIIHPDIIKDFNLWKPFQQHICIENMDTRKPIGRTVEELDYIFNELPDASLCFDLAHARQVDPTMIEGFKILKKYAYKVKQIHISDVNSSSNHERINLAAILSFKNISHLIPVSVPIIIESPVTEFEIDLEIQNASFVFENELFEKYISEIKNPFFNQVEIEKLMHQNQKNLHICN